MSLIKSIKDELDKLNLSKINKTVNLSKVLKLAIDGYTLVTWPDVQEYMGKDWFEREAILEVEGNFGNSAYFIPIKRIVDTDIDINNSCQHFNPDSNFTSATKCKCGKEKWEHLYK